MKFFIGFFAAISMHSLANACEIKSAYEPWEPYQFKDGGTLKGIDIEIAEAIGQSIGCKVTFTELPWSRQLKDLETGALDMLAAASKTPEREAFATYADGYRNETISVFVKAGTAGKIKIGSPADLAKLSGKVGILRENSYGDATDAVIKGNKAAFDEVASDNLNMKKLAADRLTAALADKYSGASAVAKEGLKGKVEEHSYQISSSPVYYIFSKKIKDPALAQKWNKAMLDLKKSKKIDEILKKYSL